MPERLEAAFVFGSLGNLSEALGTGWSVEDNWAWAIGAESRLNLSLPSHAAHYIVRLTLQPLVNPGVLDAQRLSIETAAGKLASFSIDRRTTIELALPIEQTRDRSRIELILRHPDALRPSGFKKSDDTRLLSLCFMSGTLARQSDDLFEHPAEAAPLCHLIVAGGDLARQIAEVMTALPVFRQRVACHFVNTDQGRGAAPPPTEALQSAAVCWEQSGGNAAAGWPRLRRMLPADCDLRRFASPRMGALWPFLGADPRLVFEAGLYPGGRYPFGDRIGASLAYVQLPDDIMQLSYQSMTEKEMPDLDALLAADLAAWRQLDATHDVKVADFIVENFSRFRLFFAPPYPGGDFLRHLIGQLVAGSPVEALCNPATLRRELDFLLAGYLGRREELPIHPQVARRFGLAWWRPGMRYRWHSNHWTFEEYALRYIRWTPWRP
jgi:hypothetical protein